MNRRQLLLGTAGLAVAGGVLAAVQPRRSTLPPFGSPPPDLPRRPEGERRVVVVGGGLAGISAATELAERGFRVTLVERAPHLGGKLSGWPVEALGETFPLEHGFHGFFRQYANLDRLLGPVGALDRLAWVDRYPVWFPDGAEKFGSTTSLFPLNLAAVVVRSDRLSLTDFVAYDPGLLELLRYRPDTTFAELDGLDFATFCKERVVNQDMCETVLLPFAETTLNRPGALSAAEAIRFFHAYFIGNPEGLGFRVATTDVGTGILEPLRKRLVELGVDVRTGADVTRLRREGDRVKGVAVAVGGRPSVADARVPTDQVGERWTEARGADGTVAWVRRDPVRGLVALDARCSHMGCPVKPAVADRGFVCPCHHGRYDDDGAVLGGPPPRPLDRLEVVEEGGEVVVRAAEVIEEDLLEADHVVLATDVKGTQRLLAASDLGLGDLEEAMAAMGVADPYVVWRLWLDKPVPADVEPFYTVAGAGDLDALAVYSAFQAPFVDWAKRTGGSVIEAHAYAIPPERMAEDEVLRERLWAQVVSVLPQLEGAKVLAEAFMRHEDFTRYAPGDRARRPGTRTALDGLVLAGDWVRIDAPVFLMEAAVTSGRLAANAVFDREGLAQEDIPVVALEGPLAL